MRRVLVGSIGATAALVAAVALYTAVTLPPRAVVLNSHPTVAQVLGGYHIHSSRSDGTGTVDDIASAASRAGLAFIILTDHGDATRQGDAPSYRHGVLCIDAHEISSFDGHVVALNLARASAYPLAGETRDVVEDIHRLGGWAVAAHPDSPRAELRWRQAATAFDGIEWVNADSEWRHLALPSLLAAGARALVRPPETLAALLHRPEQSLRRWDVAARSRPIFSLAALDAHARLGFDDQTPARGVAIARPRYEDLFAAVAQAVILPAALTGNASEDAAAVMRAIAVGRSFSIIRGFAGPASLNFAVTRGSERAELGQSLPDGTGRVAVSASVPEAPESRVALIRNGDVVAEGAGRVDYSGEGTPGNYRVEVFFGTHGAPWIVSNAIRVGGADVPGEQPSISPAEGDRVSPTAIPVPPDGWQIERDPTSDASIQSVSSQLSWVYTLGQGAPAGQYVALATSATGEASLDRIEFTAQAAAPMRLSLQIRLPGGANGRRWRRSVYVDEMPRRVSIRVADLLPIEADSSLRPIRARVQSVLLVVDTLNARPGTAGRVTLSDVMLWAEPALSGTHR